MRRHLFAALFAVATLAPLSAAPRVIVQDAPDTYPYYYRLSHDGSHLAYVAGVWQHLFVVVDLKNECVLHQIYVPEEIVSYDFAADHKGLAFVTRTGVHWLDVDTGDLQLVAPGNYSRVAVGPGANLIGVLGQLGDPGIRSFGTPQSLGVLDRTAKTWKFKVSTPIVTEGRLASTLAFHGGEFLARGTGGDPSPMLPSLFPCDVRLDLKTGHAVITTGPMTGRFGSKLAEGKIIPPPLPKDLPEGVKIIFTEKYVLPKVLKQADEKAAMALKEREFDKVLQKVSPTTRTSYNYQPMMNRLQGDDLQLALLLHLNKKHFRSQIALLNLNRNGKITLGPTKEYKEGRLGLKDLHYVRSWEEDFSVWDLNKENLLFQLDINSKRQRYFHFFEDGTLLIDGGYIAFYPVGEKKPAWHFADSGSWHGLLRSADEEIVAVTGSGGSGRAVLLRRKDGKLLAKIPHFVSSGLAIPQALSPDAKQHALINDSTLHIFDAATGKAIVKHDIKGKASYPRVFAWSGGWFIGGYDHALTFHPKTGWGKPFPIREVMHVQEVPAAKGKRLILQDGRGRCSLVDPESNTILTEWIAGFGASSDAPPYNTLLPGGVVLRSLGMRGEVDLLDADTAQVLACIHTVPAAKDTIGFILHTPDGLWDATPGAERHVMLFDNGRVLNEEERNARRDPEAIAERIRNGFK